MALQLLTHGTTIYAYEEEKAYYDWDMDQLWSELDQVCSEDEYSPSEQRRYLNRQIKMVETQTDLLDVHVKDSYLESNAIRVLTDMKHSS